MNKQESRQRHHPNFQELGAAVIAIEAKAVADLAARVDEHFVRACDDYVPAGYFIPCIPNGVPLTPGINDVVVDEIDTYGRDFFTRLKERP